MMLEGRWTERRYDNKKVIPLARDLTLSLRRQRNGSAGIAAKVGKKTNVAKSPFRNYLRETPVLTKRTFSAGTPLDEP